MFGGRLAHSQVRQVFAPWLHNTFRLYTDSAAIESFWTIGPVSMSTSTSQPSESKPPESDFEAESSFSSVPALKRR